MSQKQGQQHLCVTTHSLYKSTDIHCLAKRKKKKKHRPLDLTKQICNSLTLDIYCSD